MNLTNTEAEFLARLVGHHVATKVDDRDMGNMVDKLYTKLLRRVANMGEDIDTTNHRLKPIATHLVDRDDLLVFFVENMYPDDEHDEI